MAFLIHDNDTKSTSSFDSVFSSEGIEIVHTPYQAPRANAFAERWVRSVREECLDRILILNENHLRKVLGEYTDYYNLSRVAGRAHLTGLHQFVLDPDDPFPYGFFLTDPGIKG